MGMLGPHRAALGAAWGLAWGPSKNNIFFPGRAPFFVRLSYFIFWTGKKGARLAAICCVGVGPTTH
jgi:hypothetical protein